jgi:WD40 repeat protein
LVDETTRIDRVYSAVFALDGKTIAAAGIPLPLEGDEEVQATIFLCDVSDADYTRSSTVVNTHGIVYSFEYSPDGRHFATGASNGTIRLWNAADNSCAKVMTGHRDAVMSIAFSPNGKIIASACRDGCVRLWSVEDGDGSSLVELLDHHEGPIFSAAFSPDGQTLASSGRDGTVRLWNPHEEDRKQFKQVDWGALFLLWNFRNE